MKCGRHGWWGVGVASHREWAWSSSSENMQAHIDRHEARIYTCAPDTRQEHFRFTFSGLGGHFGHSNTSVGQGRGRGGVCLGPVGAGRALGTGTWAPPPGTGNQNRPGPWQGTDRLKGPWEEWPHQPTRSSFRRHRPLPQPTTGVSQK